MSGFDSPVGYGPVAGFGAAALGEAKKLPPGVWATSRGKRLIFQNSDGERLMGIPSTFTRASQAWDGTGLVAPNTMRVFGRDTKSPVVLIEGQRTNLFLNSDAPVEQTFAGTGAHTISMHGTGSLQLSGDSTAVVTEGNPVTVTLSNTLTVTPVGNVQWAQVEAAPFPSSHIPTDGAPATRAQDNFFVDLPPISADEPLTWNFALRGQGSRGWGAMSLREAGGGGVSSTTPRVFFGRRTGVLFDVYSYGGGEYLGLTVEMPEPRLYPITIVTTATHVSLHVDGSLVGVAESTRQLTIGRAFVGSTGTSTHDYRNLYAPGAAAIGIPFIDNRAWSAEEIQAAHARWLPELAKIEVPV